MYGGGLYSLPGTQHLYTTAITALIGGHKKSKLYFYGTILRGREIELNV